MSNQAYFTGRYKKLFSDFDIDKSKLNNSLRINTLKSNPKEVIKRLKTENIKIEKLSFTDYGFIYTADFSLGSNPDYLQGYYYLQEAASQIPAIILNPTEKDSVMDMCAAPGSKTTQMAALMNNKGSIVALDNTKWRLFALRNNIERLGIKNVLIYNKDARFAMDFKQKFDKILLDAPCSGNFMIDKTWFEKRTEQDIIDKTIIQKAMLKTALLCLKENGTMIYSTCSLEPEENEYIIDWLLEKYPNKVKLEKIDINIGSNALTNVFGKELNPEISKCIRLLPWRDNTQGFFIAKIKKIA